MATDNTDGRGPEKGADAKSTATENGKKDRTVEGYALSRLPTRPGAIPMPKSNSLATRESRPTPDISSRTSKKGGTATVPPGQPIPKAPAKTAAQIEPKSPAEVAAPPADAKTPEAPPRPEAPPKDDLGDTLVGGIDDPETVENLFDASDVKAALEHEREREKALDAAALDESTIQLAEDDLVLFKDEDTASGLPRPPKAPPMPRKTNPFGTPIAHGTTADLSLDDIEPITVDQPPPKAAPLDPPPAFEDDARASEERRLEEIDIAQFYSHEARALAAKQPEHAALMMLEAAHESMTSAEDGAETARLLGEARKLAPASTLVLPLLRASFQQIGRHDVALDLAHKLLESGGQAQERVAIALEAAAIVYHHKGDARGALTEVEQALATSPANAAALALAVELELALGAYAKAVASLERLTEALSAPAERSICLHLAATLQETRLDQPKVAAETYGRAVDAAPDNVPALLALCDLLEEIGKHEELARRLEQLAELDTEGAVEHLLRAGALHLDRTRDILAATRCFVAAIERAPQNRTPLVRLAYVLELRGKWQELIDVATRLLDLTVDLDGKVVLLSRIGWVHHNRLGARDKAIAAYTQALQLVPGYLPALQAVGTLHRQKGDFQALLELLLPETEGGDPPHVRAIRCVEAGDIYADELGKNDEAADAYRRALELRPGWPVAFWKLRRVLRGADRHAALATVLEAQLEHTKDVKTRNHLLFELGQTLAGPLQRPDEGIAVLQRASRSPATRTGTIALIDLYDRYARHAERAELMLEEAKDIKDPQEALAHRLMAANLFERQLDEPNRALEIYLQILEAEPTNASATRAAGRVYYRLERWIELIELYRHELRSEPERADAAELLCRIARVYEVHVGELGAAIDACTQALQRDPESTVALDQLMRLVRREERDKQLVLTLVRHATQRKDPHARADALCRAAEICENRLDDDDAAAKHYAAALAEHAGSITALSGLARIQLRKRDWKAAVTALGDLAAALPEDSAARRHTELRAARLAEHRLRMQPDLERLQRAVSADYGHYLRLDLTRVLLRAHPEQSAEALLALAEKTADKDLRAAYALLAAQRDEFGGDRARQISAAQLAFANAPNQPVVYWQLQRALYAGGQFGALAEQLEQEAAQQGDPAFRLPLLERATRAMLAAEQPDEAARLARQALAVDQKHLPSLLSLARMAEQGQRFSELATYCDQLAGACAARENRLVVCLLASDLWAHHAQDPVHALASLQHALDDDPGQPDAFARAERLLITTGDFERLSRLYSRRIQLCNDSSQKVELLRLNARLLRDRLDDTPRAISELAALLSHAPKDIDALADQAQLLARQWRWSDAVNTLSTLIDVTDDGAVVRDAMLHQARIWLEHLHEPARAREVLLRILEASASEVEAQQILVRVYFAEGAWAPARKLLDELVKAKQRSLQVWALAQMAELARVGLRDEELRKRSEIEALRRASADASLLEQLRQQYETNKESRRLAQLTQEVITETTDADVVGPLRLMVAKMLLALKEPREAIDHLQALAMIQPDNDDAQLLWAQSQEALGDSEGAAERYRRLVASTDRATQVEAARGLSRLMAFLGQPAIASAAAALLLLRGEAQSGEAQQITALEQSGPPYGELDLGSLPVPRELGPLRELFALSLPHLSNVYKIKPSEPLPAGHKLLTPTIQLAVAFGLPAPKISIEEGAALAGMPARVGIGHPPALFLSAALARDGFTARFRFWAGRALALATGPGALFETLDDEELDLFVTALMTARPLDSLTQQLRKQLTRAMPRRARKQAEALNLSPPGPDVWTRYRVYEMQRADRAGMLAASNPHVALSELATSIGQGIDSPRLMELQRYSLSDEYAQHYAALWSRRAS